MFRDKDVLFNMLYDRTNVVRYDKTIIPRWEIMLESMSWAESFPESYTVYTAGIITYNTEADLTLFLVKWS